MERNGDRDGAKPAGKAHGIPGRGPSAVRQRGDRTPQGNSLASSGRALRWPSLSGWNGDQDSSASGRRAARLRGGDRLGRRPHGVLEAERFGSEVAHMRARHELTSRVQLQRREFTAGANLPASHEAGSTAAASPAAHQVATEATTSPPWRGVDAATAQLRSSRPRAPPRVRQSSGRCAAAALGLLRESVIRRRTPCSRRDRREES